MWARVLECVMACWLVLSRFIFRYDAGDGFLRVNDLVCAALVMALAFLSFWKPLRYIHLAIIPVGLWLLGVAFLHSDMLPAYRNYMVVGVLLLLLAIVPNYASEPPHAWSAYMGKAQEHK